MLRDLLRAGNCCMNQGNVGSYTNADGDTAVWLNCGRNCLDKSYCCKLFIVLEAENNMRNSVEAITGGKR